MFKFILTSLVILLFVNGVTSCGGGGRSSSRRTGWGWNNGPSYTFRNGVRVTGSGSLSPFRVGIGVDYRFKRDVGEITNNKTTTGEKGKRGLKVTS